MSDFANAKLMSSEGGAIAQLEASWVARLAAAWCPAHREIIELERDLSRSVIRYQRIRHIAGTNFDVVLRNVGDMLALAAMQIIACSRPEEAPVLATCALPGKKIPKSLREPTLENAAVHASFLLLASFEHNLRSYVQQMVGGDGACVEIAEDRLEPIDASVRKAP